MPNPAIRSHEPRVGATLWTGDSDSDLESEPFAYADWKILQQCSDACEKAQDSSGELLLLKLVREKKCLDCGISHRVRVFNLYCHPDDIKIYRKNYSWVEPGPRNLRFDYLIARVEFLDGPLRGKKMLIDADFLKSMVTPEQADRIRKRLGIKDGAEAEAENDKPPLIPGQTKPRD